jgi:hypothetical protein
VLLYVGPGYKIGFVKVRTEPPQQSVFETLSGVEHGHAACYDFRPEPSAGEDTLQWPLGTNVFVSNNGIDLQTFAAAKSEWQSTGSDIFVFWELLKPLANR